MADTRMSSFLPMVKCSMCAQDIEISMMGEHVCTGVPEATPPLPALDTRGTFPAPNFGQRMPNSPSLSKPSRTKLPTVDTGAANRPFYANGALTPGSASSESRNPSPMTPHYEGRRSPFSGPPKAAKLAVRRLGPPSPEILSSNLDSAFPPFPRPKSPNRRDRARDVTGPSPRFAGSDTGFAPRSPREINNGGFLQRMNSIAPGPFDMNGRREARGQSEDRLDSVRAANSIRRPATANDNRKPLPADSGLVQQNVSGGSNDLPILPKLERTNGYGGFGPPPSAENAQQPKSMLRAEDRSQTFPSTPSDFGQSFPIARRPSEPINSPAQRQPSVSSREPTPQVRRDSPPRHAREPSMPSLERTKAPPRGVSLIAGLSSNANLNLAAEFGTGNPYHTPSESQSSNGSTVSMNSRASSRSSPPGSSRPPQTRRQPSDTAGIDSVMNDVSAKIGQDARDSQPREPYMKTLPNSRALEPSLLSPEPHTDPAIQGGRLSPGPSASSTPPSDLKPRRRPTTSKGDCKGCMLPIKGKSVSSADGRLTGRYHKDCFVCMTCKEPFATTKFYVLKDAPYCERHYHQANNSVCKTCDKGIEGQYLETERKQKYHPNCLTCTDCRRVLRDDYFEMNGKVYCERDAMRKASQRPFLGPGMQSTNRMERRTTRLMMMI